MSEHVTFCTLFCLAEMCQIAGTPFNAGVSRKALSAVLAPGHPTPTLEQWVWGQTMWTPSFLWWPGTSSVHNNHCFSQAAGWPKGCNHSSFM